MVVFPAWEGAVVAPGLPVREDLVVDRPCLLIGCPSSSPTFSSRSSCLEHLALEAAATSVMVYAPQQIPELLQVAAYADAAAEASLPLSDHHSRERSVQATLTRQRAVMQARQGLSAVIGQAALSQVVSSRRVMRSQLIHLAELCDSQAEIRVLPFRSVLHPAPGLGPMTVLRFGPAAGLSVVYLADMTGGRVLTGAAAVSVHVRAYEQLRSRSLAPGESAAMIRKMAA
jgi:hypothetical protein